MGDRARSWAVAALVSTVLLGGAAEAQSPLNISALVNDDLTTYSNGSNYPQNGGPLTVAGVTFTLSTISPSGHTGVIQSSTTSGLPQTFSISVNRTGVTTVNTLINSAFGSCGTSVGE